MSRGGRAGALDLADFPVDEIRLGSPLRYAGRTLEADEAELAAAASQDPRILSARLDSVRPGERVRVTGVRDVAEPGSRSTAPARCSRGSPTRWSPWAPAAPTGCRA